MGRSKPFRTYAMDEELGTTYTPKLLAKQPILFSPRMLSIVSRAECDYSRTDESISHSPYKDATKEVLLNLEALAASVIDGDSIDLIDLLTSNIAPSVTKMGKVNSFTHSARVIHYKEMIQKHSSPEWAKSVTFSEKSIFELHAELSYSDPAEFKMAYRGATTGDPKTVHERLPQMRTLPPNQIPLYMRDLCEFCNDDSYTPQIQACLPHFQIEYIKPFKSHIEALGRHISYAIYARRGFGQNVIIPAALTSLSRINMPVDPYKVDNDPKHQPMSLWIEHGAKCLEISSQFTRNIENNLRRIEEEWRTKLPSIRKNGLCDILLRDMLSNPVINSSYIAKISNKTLPAIGSALNKLQEVGILRPLNNQKRYRLFYAEDIINYYYTLFDAYLPPQWVPGKSLFTD